MSAAELQRTKSGLKKWIDQLSDVNMLHMLDGLRASNSDKISWEELSEFQRQNITEGLKDIENGRVMTSEEFWRRLNDD
jgi:predicted transcriptional regulator